MGSDVTIPPPFPDENNLLSDNDFNHMSLGNVSPIATKELLVTSSGQYSFVSFILFQITESEFL